jgi:hypothetical protein
VEWLENELRGEGMWSEESEEPTDAFLNDMISQVDEAFDRVDHARGVHKKREENPSVPT